MLLTYNFTRKCKQETESIANYLKFVSRKLLYSLDQEN